MKALEAALSQNPHLTSLPLPRPTVLAPSDLSQTSGTAEILRLPEVRSVIDGDFIVLPCDLVCSIHGESFVEQWMIQQATLDLNGGQIQHDGVTELTGVRSVPKHKGGLGVWFHTKGEGSVKGEETDFIITSPLEEAIHTNPQGSLASDIRHLVYSTTKDTLKDIIDDKGHFPLRPTLIRKYGKTKMLSTYRDAHIYMFPRWVVEFVAVNPTLDSISEDVVGWWAKCGWQSGLAQKLGLDTVLRSGAAQGSVQDGSSDSLPDVNKLSSASRTSTLSQLDEYSARTKSTRSQVAQSLPVPSILAYVQPSGANVPLVRRVDTAALLLSVSLHLAKQQSAEDASAEGAVPSPFAHPSKIAHPSGIAPRCTVTKADCLLAENVTVEEKCVIKESVIGANCHIKIGARLTRCVLMDGAVVGDRCQLSGCILGRRSQVGKESVLKDCEVQDGNKVPDETDSKGEKFMIFEGLEEDESGMEMDETESEMEV